MQFVVTLAVETVLCSDDLNVSISFSFYVSNIVTKEVNDLLHDIRVFSPTLNVVSVEAGRTCVVV